MSLLDDALALAAYFPVFPCKADKRPVTDHGFKDATQDAARLRSMFSLPAAALIGLPTGAVSGFDVLDVDSGRHPEAAVWHGENRHRLPETRVHRTRSGGLHYIFLHQGGLRNSANAIGPFIDRRASGGYIIAALARLHGAKRCPRSTLAGLVVAAAVAATITRPDRVSIRWRRAGFYRRHHATHCGRRRG